MKTIQELIRDSTEYLRTKGVENPRLEAELLLADALDCERIDLYAGSDKNIAADILSTYRRRIEQRGTRMPTAYIVGYRHFYKSRFFVSANVFIPRPESEGLVDWILKEGPAQNGRLLDLCCGSGCIGLSLLAERPDLILHLADISQTALSAARENAGHVCPRQLENISFFESDLFTALPPKPYAAIVCNPPYIHPDELATLMPEIKNHEPEQSLFHPEPLDLYYNILNDAFTFLESDGILALEIGPRWARPLRLFARGLFSRVDVRMDLAGLDRYLYARK